MARSGAASDPWSLARVETSLPVIAPGAVPSPRFWRPEVRELHATVVDLGHDAWRVSAHPLTGAGEWLRRGSPAPRPALVVRTTRPSLIHAEQVLARLDSWIGIAAVTPPSQLLVMGPHIRAPQASPPTSRPARRVDTRIRPGRMIWMTSSAPTGCKCSIPNCSMCEEM